MKSLGFVRLSINIHSNETNLSVTKHDVLQSGQINSTELNDLDGILSWLVKKNFDLLAYLVMQILYLRGLLSANMEALPKR